MPAFRVPPPLRRLGRWEPWLAFLIYALFGFASFSIAGMDAAVLLLYLLLLARWRRDPAWSELPRWLLWAFFLVPAAALISALANGVEAAPAAGVVPPSHLDSLFQLRHLYRLVLPLALLPALTRVRLRRLLLTLLVPAGLMAIYAVIQFHWGVDWYRPVGRKVITPYGGAFAAAGTFTHHLTFGGIMMMLTLLFGALACLDGWRLRWVWGLGAGLCGMAVVASLARSDWLGLISGLVLAVAGFPRRLVRPVVVTALVLVLLGAMIGSGWLTTEVGRRPEPALVKRLLASTLADNQERLHLWESALMGIRDRPWLGVGYYNYRPYVVAYRKEMIKRYGTRFHIGLDAQMHNVLLEVAFGLGIVGTAAFVAWWVAIFGWVHSSLALAGPEQKLERAILYGAAAALGGILVAGMFENNFFDAEVQTVIMMLIALCLQAGLALRRGAATTGQQAPPGA